MRAFEGQHSDNVAIKRSREQKQLILQQLRDQLAGLKPTVNESIRTNIIQKIKSLEEELSQPEQEKKPRAKPSARTSGPSRPNSFRQ
ncbi:Periplasmic heavy metal sensor [Azospirillaceae bacterium]